MNNKNVKKIGNLYVALVVLLMVVALIVAIAGVMNRQRKAVAELEKTETRVESTTKKAEKDNAEDVFSPSKGDETTKVETTPPETTEPVDVFPEFINPTGGIVTKEYSVDTPVFSATMEDYRTHSGIDIFVNVGERVLAASDGVIKEIWDDPMMGTSIKIAHSGGAETVYKNLSSEIPEGIEVGKNVTSGEFIAVSGETALEEISEDSHIHFEIFVNGESVNPADYINFSEGITDYEG